MNKRTEQDATKRNPVFRQAVQERNVMMLGNQKYFAG